MLVKDILKENVITCTKDEKIIDAIKKMYNHNIGSVLIVENEKVIGILTERDIIRLIATGKSLEERIENFMTKNPITIRYDEYIQKAALIMRENNIRHLPVVNKEGKLVGIISVRDLAKYISEIEI